MRFLTAGVVLVGVVAAVHLWRSSRFQRNILDAAAQLVGGDHGALTPRTDLPAEIEAFARRGVSSPEPGAVSIGQVGEMRLTPESRWSALTAEHTVSTVRPSFVWHARVETAPLLPAVVVDSYVSGVGRLEARLLGSIRVALAEGPVTDRAELMRYLAELPWTPEAILFNRHLDWRPLGNGRFEVSADSSGGRAVVQLSLDSEGDITQAAADDRPMGTGRESVPTPWLGKFSDYGDVGGFRIPRRAEVSWLLPEGEFSYWRGEITSVQRK